MADERNFLIFKYLTFSAILFQYGGRAHFLISKLFKRNSAIFSNMVAERYF